MFLFAMPGAASSAPWWEFGPSDRIVTQTADNAAACFIAGPKRLDNVPYVDSPGPNPGMLGMSNWREFCPKAEAIWRASGLVPDDADEIIFFMSERADDGWVERNWIYAKGRPQGPWTIVKRTCERTRFFGLSCSRHKHYIFKNGGWFRLDQ